mmetsp:Transcript_128938/g.223661  ORF Transcript_128938/g.223661 Transcript_128938/m.223661 type:complete len:209 (+) Transcript_128938:1843-2469(+)
MFRQSTEAFAHGKSAINSRYSIKVEYSECIGDMRLNRFNSLKATSSASWGNCAASRRRARAGISPSSSSSPPALPGSGNGSLPPGKPGKIGTPPGGPRNTRKWIGGVDGGELDSSSDASPSVSSDGGFSRSWISLEIMLVILCTSSPSNSSPLSSPRLSTPASALSSPESCLCSPPSLPSVSLLPLLSDAPPRKRCAAPKSRMAARGA